VRFFFVPSPSSAPSRFGAGSWDSWDGRLGAAGRSAGGGSEVGGGAGVDRAVAAGRGVGTGVRSSPPLRSHSRRRCHGSGWGSGRCGFLPLFPNGFGGSRGRGRRRFWLCCDGFVVLGVPRRSRGSILVSKSCVHHSVIYYPPHFSVAWGGDWIQLGVCLGRGSFHSVLQRHRTV